MSAASLRRTRRAKTAELIAAGKHGRKSHFIRSEIAQAITQDVVEAPRQRPRIVVEPNWHLRSQPKERAAVNLLTNRNLESDHADNRAFRESVQSSAARSCE